MIPDTASPIDETEPCSGSPTVGRAESEFDLDALTKLCPTPADVEIFLSLMLEDLRRNHNDLKRTLDANDTTAAARAAHSMGSAAAFVCAPLLTTPARELEHRLKNGHIETIADLRAQVEARATTLIAALEQWLRLHTTPASPTPKPAAASRRSF